MTKQKPSKATAQQALDVYRTAERPGPSRAFLSRMLTKTRKYERAARQQGDHADAEVYRANAELVAAVLDEGGDG